MAHPSDNSPLNPGQQGFVRKISRTTSTTDCFNTAAKAGCAGKSVVAAYLDVEKALNRLSHSGQINGIKYLDR